MSGRRASSPAPWTRRIYGGRRLMSSVIPRGPAWWNTPASTNGPARPYTWGCPPMPACWICRHGRRSILGKVGAQYWKWESRRKPLDVVCRRRAVAAVRWAATSSHETWSSGQAANCAPFPSGGHQSEVAGRVGSFPWKLVFECTVPSSPPSSPSSPSSQSYYFTSRLKPPWPDRVSVAASSSSSCPDIPDTWSPVRPAPPPPGSGAWRRIPLRKDSGRACS